MKKLMLLAAAALSVSVAQAVTVQWNTGTETWTGDINLGTATTVTNSSSVSDRVIGTISYSTSFTVLANLTITTSGSYAAGNRYPALLGLGDGDNSIRFNSNEPASNASHVISTTGASRLTDVDDVLLESNTTYQLVMSYDADTGLLSMFIDGVLYATTTVDSTSTYTSVLLGQQRTDGGQLLSSGATYTADVYVVQGSDVYTLVPEPTCLALLALGVAGLALRRRA